MAAGELGGGLRIGAERRPVGEVREDPAGVLVASGEHGGLHEAGHGQPPHREVAPPRPGQDQESEPVGRVEGAPPPEVGAGRRPLGEGGRLGEPAPAGRVQGGRDVPGDGVRLLLDRRGERQYRPVVGRRVALPGPQGGAQPSSAWVRACGCRPARSSA